MNAKLNKACLHKAYQILSRRDHSCAELYRKLERYGYERKEIKPVVDECRRLEYLDDERFANTYCEQLQRKGFGISAIKQKMYARGLSKEVTRKSLDTHCDDTSQLATCRRVLAKKTKNLSDDSIGLKARAKHRRFLLSRGFSFHIVHQVIGEAIRRGEESE